MACSAAEPPRTVNQPLDPADAALAAALSAPLPGEDDGADGELLPLPELAERTGLSLPLLEALEREGLLIARDQHPPRFAPADAEAVRAGLALVDAGLPLAELLDLARRTDEALREVAGHAVDLFVAFVRDPVQGTAATSDEAAERLVTAFRAMLPATERLVGHHFRRLLVAAARERLTATGPADAGS